MRTTVLAATLLLGAVVAPSHADEPAALRGRRVRILVPPPAEGKSRAVEGKVRATGQDGLVVTTRNGDVVVPWTSVERLEIAAHPSRGCGVLRGAGIGVITGAGFGAVLGAVAGSGDRVYSSGTLAMAGAMVYGTLGGGVGALAGVAAPCTTWEIADRARFTVEPQRGGVGARLSFRF